MLTNLPAYVIIIFLLTVALTFYLFVRSVRKKAFVSVVLLLWLLLTGILSFKGVFQNTSATPPRLALIMVPAFAVIVLVLVTNKGTQFTDELDLRKITLVHIVRIPVEITLLLLASRKVIPELMTFAGRNFDIISGLTSPIIYFICFKNSQVINRKLLLVWNFACLALLLNIVINAVLSLPYPFQQFAFDQPNIAVLYFPFTWLPCFIVIIVLYGHLAAIRKLFKRERI